jgi:hypothetical protein
VLATGFTHASATKSIQDLDHDTGKFNLEDSASDSDDSDSDADLAQIHTAVAPIQDGATNQELHQVHLIIGAGLFQSLTR